MRRAIVMSVHDESAAAGGDPIASPGMSRSAAGRVDYTIHPYVLRASTRIRFLARLRMSTWHAGRTTETFRVRRAPNPHLRAAIDR
jgi:hypothetical protein